MRKENLERQRKGETKRRKPKSVKTGRRKKKGIKKRSERTEGRKNEKRIDPKGEEAETILRREGMELKGCERKIK